jgi:hypothetical protein
MKTVEPNFAHIVTGACVKMLNLRERQLTALGNILSLNGSGSHNPFLSFLPSLLLQELTLHRQKM